jgi:dolichyl-phosphate-mannose-protein mannosyltransferase
MTERRRGFAIVFTAALSLYAVTASGSLTSSDAVVTFDLTRSLVERHSIALSGDLLGNPSNRGVDGRYYSQFGIGQSIFNIPFYLAGTAAAALMPHPLGKPDTVPKAFVALGSSVAAATAVALIWVLAVLISEDGRGALVAAASAAIAGPLWPYSKSGFSTALTTAVLAAAATCCWSAAARRSRGWAFGAGAVVAAGWLTRHELALVVVPFSFFLWIEGRRRATAVRSIASHILCLLTVSAAGGALWMTYNAIRFGHPTAVGYSPRFSGVGYAAYLLSPAGSVLVFAPIALVWLWALLKLKDRLPGAAMLLVGPLVVFYTFYGALQDWPGGRSYGPRYLVPSLTLLAPALAAIYSSMVHRQRRRIAAALIAGALLQLPGVVVDYSKVSVEWAHTATREEIAARNWRVTSSFFILNLRAAARLVPENIAYLSGRKAVPPLVATGDEHAFAQQFSYSLDFWWVYLVYLRVLTVGEALAAAVFLVLATGTMWRAAILASPT